MAASEYFCHSSEKSKFTSVIYEKFFVKVHIAQIMYKNHILK